MGLGVRARTAVCATKIVRVVLVAGAYNWDDIIE